MPEPVDMVELVHTLFQRRRGRACAVLTHDFSGQRGWAEKLAVQTGAECLNLLDSFSDNRGFSGDLGTFTVDRFFEFLSEKKTDGVLIVSGIEAIKATWSAQPSAMEDFASRLETWDRSPALLLVMQYDTQLAARPSSRRYGHTFVIDQRETLAL
jgi:hypothetical protein